MPVTNEVDVARDDPPDEAAYQSMPVPVAVRLATVGFDTEQNVCDAVPVGAAGFDIVAVTANLVVLSQPAIVCEA